MTAAHNSTANCMSNFEPICSMHESNSSIVTADSSRIVRATSKVYQVTRQASSSAARKISDAGLVVKTVTTNTISGASDLATQATNGITKSAGAAIVKTQDLAANPTVQDTARGAAGGAALLGGAASYTGSIVGAAVGAAAGIPASLFTFGASIPAGAAAGSAVGATAGATLGGTAGIVSGGTAGYIYSRYSRTSPCPCRNRASDPCPPLPYGGTATQLACVDASLGDGSAQSTPKAGTESSHANELSLRILPRASDLRYALDCAAESHVNRAELADTGAQCDLMSPRSIYEHEGAEVSDISNVEADGTSPISNSSSRDAKRTSAKRITCSITAGADNESAYSSSAAEWIQAITGIEVSRDNVETLRTGELLCQVINGIKPGTISKIERPGMPFRDRENISSFLKACRDLGVQEYALFSTDDLYAQKNMFSVWRCIHALGGAVQRTVPDFAGPHLGHADLSKWRDTRRTPKFATQTGGLHCAMDSTRSLHVERTCSKNF